MEYLKNAKFVNLSNCCNITNKGLMYLKNALEIDISFIDNITDNGLDYLEKVVCLNLTNCKRISFDNICKWKK